jgi:putative hydrolase of the HAD superfamily
MEWYGYGAMAFTLSLIETAIRVTQAQVSATILAELLKAGKSILDKPIQLFPGIPDILPSLSDQYRLVVVTKGDLLDQERKLAKSGLLPYFQHVEVVTEKHEANYKQLIEFMNIEPSEFLMVGNSLKSDILPVLSIGAKAVHVPFHMEWEYEKTDKPATPYIELETLFELPAVLKG